ncbi:outer membrane receptor for ferrienterochelin and colicins [Janthinobacterium sp. CG_23.3]|uniref:TonB-dependent receptor plug domain-containing protein n=1 Tax=Janthinobacterium sp. CG_23.3 TaxID=3349634 RepID=UPI0038D4562A
MAFQKQVVFSAVLGALCSAAQSQQIPSTDAAPMATVEIVGPGALARRQGDTTAKLVVSRADIDRYGDTSLSDVLKRLPGVTVSGDIRVRGLGNGYTQILVNGDPVPNGFSIDSISPELIERVELLRAPTVEYAAQAIAGTINIVLRKTSAKRQREAKLGAVSDRAGTTPNVSLQLADRLAGLSYSVSGVAKQDKVSEPGGREQLAGAGPDGIVDLRRESRYQYNILNRSLALAPRLQWTLDNADTLTSQSLVELSDSKRHGSSVETTLLGAPSDYPVNSFAADNRVDTVRSDVAWTHSGADGTRLDAKLGIIHNRRKIHYVFLGAAANGARGLDRTVDSEARDDQLTSSGKYAAPFFKGHSLVAGWDGSLTRRGEYRLQHDVDGFGVARGDLDENYDARVKRLAFFVQDEWDITPRWQMYLGLRWEGLYTDSLSNVVLPVHNRSGVWSPVLQTLWKLPGSEKDQVRLALTRSYKAPTTPSLIPRRYTANNDNGPTNPDRQGNPQLRPELAWGLDAAFEHYFAKSGMLSVSAFVRRVKDVTVERLYRENGVWIASPVNDGNASVRGIEFEVALPLAPPVDVKFNLSRNWSALDSVPGPNNRLGGQTPFSANVGLDYRVDAWLSAGGNYGFKSAAAVSVSAFLSNEGSPTRTLDLYGLMKFSPLTQLRASAFNLLRQDSYSASYYADDGGATLRSARSRSNRGLRLTLEHRY